MNYWQDQYATMALKNDELVKKNLELEEKLAAVERLSIEYEQDLAKCEKKLSIAIEALEQISEVNDEQAFESKGNSIAREALEKIKG